MDADDLVDLTTTDITVLNADGSQFRTVTDTAANGLARDQTFTTTSADGKTIHIQAATNSFGQITFDETQTIQPDGSTLISISYPNTPLSSEINTSSTSANGLIRSVRINDPTMAFTDFDSTTTLNADGSTQTLFVNHLPYEYDVTSTTSADGLTKTTSVQGTANYGDPNLTKRDFW